MKLKLVVWTLLGIIGFSLVKIAYPAQSAFNHVRELTVLISKEGIGVNSRGTGVLLDSTHVLTCAHMLEDYSDEVWVYTYPLSQVVIAHVDGMSKGADLAVLVLDSSVTVTSPPVFQETVHDGDSIIVIGNILGLMKWFVSKGIISGRDKEYLLTDALVNPGNSGGPWVNEAGEIVALTDWRIGPQPHIPGLCGGISAKTINKVLKARAAQADMQEMLKALVGGN